MTKNNQSYPLSAVRALVLHKQGLGDHVSSDGPTTPDDIYSMIKQVGCVQIDTLQMVSRSQYLTLWSRLGQYDTADFDRLMFDDADRRLFEYWMHAACIIPIEDFRYFLPVMRLYREGLAGWRRDWIQRQGNVELVAKTLEHIRDNGAVRASDFENKRSGSGAWWNWKPAKVALEHLYNQGDVMVSGRVNFQRFYDLTERVLPAHVDTNEPTHDEVRRYKLEQSIRFLGVCEPAQVADYTHMKRNEAKPYVEQLMNEGLLVRVDVELADEKSQTLVVHRDDVDLLEQAAYGGLEPHRTTFLSPFDSLFWARGRDVKFWGFQQVLEAYKPEPQRIWGYFCLPILHKGRLIGRFDPKLERKEGVLRLRSLYLEPGIAPDDEMISDVAGAMRDFMAFHSATKLVIERSDPKDFRRSLMRAM